MARHIVRDMRWVMVIGVWSGLCLLPVLLVGLSDPGEFWPWGMLWVAAIWLGGLLILGVMYAFSRAFQPGSRPLP